MHLPIESVSAAIRYRFIRQAQHRTRAQDTEAVSDRRLLSLCVMGPVEEVEELLPTRIRHAERLRQRHVSPDKIFERLKPALPLADLQTHGPRAASQQYTEVAGLVPVLIGVAP
jgi:hypothetical protein